MSNLFEKSINLGFGLFAYSREKIESVVDELVDKGEIKKNEASDFAKELIEKGKEQKEEVKKIIHEVMGDILRKKNTTENDELRTLVREELIKLIEEEGLVRKKDLEK